MDEKTAELRDIFMDVSDDETVTERQRETRGSLGAGEPVDDDRIADVVATMREQYAFDADLSTDGYVELVRAFYDDRANAVTSDETAAADDDAGTADPLSVHTDVADALDLSPETVFTALLDLHLVREADADAPFDLSVLRRRREADAAAIAADLEVDVETVERYRRIVAAEDASRAVNHRYRQAFDELLAAADLAERLTDSMEEDGLREAAEDIETDVSF